MSTKIDIKPHVVVVGGGFAGLTLSKALRKSPFRVTLIDQNNYHQFAPLFYQVAAAQIEPSSILFPYRKEIKPFPDHKFVMAKAESVDAQNRILKTNIGDISYDYLVLALGADSNFFGLQNVQKNAFPMKSVGEALALRNHLLEILEQAAVCSTEEERQQKLTITIVGGGPTGVEIAGALGEMKRYIIPRDYPQIRPEEVKILLVEGSGRLLSVMSEKSFHHANHYLAELGVDIILGKQVFDYDGQTVLLNDGSTIVSNTMIWASGISACSINGLDKPELLGRANRLKVNEYGQVQGYENIFALGDMCFQTDKNYAGGYPQVAPVAIQQAENLAKNLTALHNKQKFQVFEYKDKGSMAIVGRNRAVVDIARFHWGGFFAWAVWLFIHLFSIIGFKNKIFVILDWFFSYLFNDASLRLIVRAKAKV